MRGFSFGLESFDDGVSAPLHHDAHTDIEEHRANLADPEDSSPLRRIAAPHTIVGPLPRMRRISRMR